MKDLQVSFPLVSIGQSFKTKIIVYLGVLFLFIGLIAALWEEERIKIFFLVGSIVLLLVASLFKSYRIIGDITITEHGITINNSDGQTIYELKDVDNMQLFLESVKGDMSFSFNTFTLKRGESNCFEFLYRGEKKRLFFLLDKNMIFSIRSLIDSWNANKIKFTLHNRDKIV